MSPTTYKRHRRLKTTKGITNIIKILPVVSSIEEVLSKQYLLHSSLFGSVITCAYSKSLNQNDFFEEVHCVLI